MIYRRFGKRALDLLLVIPALVVLCPVLGGLALLVRLKLGSPVLFCQRRPGKHGALFKMYKFRSMSNALDAQGKLLPDKDRLSSVGRFLRVTSLDELPELWNVLKGDMSLIGPRPLLPQYLERYTPEHMRRHNVRPGITGWAQIHGRNNVLFSERLDLDIWYVDHCSFLLDIKILIITIFMIFKRDGVVVDQDVHEIDDLGLYKDEDQC